MKNKRTLIFCSILILFLMGVFILVPGFSKVQADNTVSMEVFQKELKKMEENNDKKMSELETKIKNLSSKVEKLETTIEEKDKAISEQSNTINDLKLKIEKINIDKLSSKVSLIEKRDQYFYEELRAHGYMSAQVAAINTLKIEE